MRIFFLLFGIFLILSWSSISFAEKDAECVASCQSEYDRSEQTKNSIFDSESYYCGYTETNCWSRATVPSGQPDPCWSLCYQSPFDNSAFQSCCHESAQINNQLSYDQCTSACKDEEPSDPCAGVVCGTQVCVNGKFYAERCVGQEGKATCIVDEQGKLADFCPKEILTSTRAWFISVEGNVQIKRKQGGRDIYIPVTPGTVAYDGDVIIGGEGALADISFPSGFMLTVTSGSEHKLDLTGKGVISEADRMKMVIIGHLNELVVKELNENKAIGMLGTRSVVFVEQEGDVLEIRLVEGSAWFTDPDSGLNVTLSPGQKITKVDGVAVSYPVDYDSAADMQNAKTIMERIGQNSNSAADAFSSSVELDSPNIQPEPYLDPSPEPSPEPINCGLSLILLGIPFFVVLLRN